MKTQAGVVPSNTTSASRRTIVSFWSWVLLLFCCCVVFGQQEAPKPAPSVVMLRPQNPQPQSTQTSLASSCPPLSVHVGDIIRTLAFSPDGHWLAAAAQDNWLAPAGNPNRLNIWNTVTGKLERTWTPSQAILQVVFSPDGTRLATVDEKGMVTVTEFPSGNVVYTVPGNLLTYTPDGKAWITAGERMLPKSLREKAEYPSRSTLEIHDAATGRLVRTIDASPWISIGPVAITPDGLLLAAGCTEDDDCEGSVQIWNLASGKLVKEYPLQGVAFSPDGRWVVDVDQTQGRLKVFDLSSGQLRQSFPLRDTRSQTTVAFSMDGSALAAAQYMKSQPTNYQGVIDVWSMPIGNQVEALRATTSVAGNDGQVEIVPNTFPSGFRSLAFSPDGKRLAAANYLIHTVRQISCDSRHTAITTSYSLVKIWDVSTGRELLTLGDQQPE